MKKTILFAGAALLATSAFAQESINLREHLHLTFPMSLNCNTKNTINNWGVPGMAVYSFGTDLSIEKLTLGDESTTVSLYYTAPGGVEELIKAYAPKEHMRVEGVELTELGDDLLEFPSSTSIDVMFAYPDDADYNLYTRFGVYRLEFSEGCLNYEGQPLAATSLVYNYSEYVTEDDEYAYTLNPAAGSQIQFNDKHQFVLSLTFTNAESYVDYLDSGCGSSLIFPTGLPLAGTNFPKVQQPNTLVWTFGKPDKNGVHQTEWPEGEYVFSIKPGTIEIDNQNFAFENVPSNFPGIEKVLFTIGNGVDGVAVIGLDKADSYDIYTLDGKAVALGADWRQFSELPAGLYIINGQKVRLVK